MAFLKGAPSERLVPQDAAERLAIARRIIADRCLYGVDINPMAVEMAKLSLWLITLDAKRPFTFLDHAFKCGDSLLGLSTFKQLESFSLRPEGGKQIAFSTMNLWRHVDEAKKKREALEAMPSDTPEQITCKIALYAEAEEAVAKLKAVADVLLALELKGLNGRAYDVERESTADHIMENWELGLEALRSWADKSLNGRRALHWPLAFPEIMDRGGFDAFVGNPPFIGGTLISGRIGKDLQVFISKYYSGQVTTGGRADLCAYFLVRANELLRAVGTFGLISTNTASEGDTREVGLEQLIASGSTIYRASSSVPWPGDASLEVAEIWCRRGQWAARRILDNKEVEVISSLLSDAIPSSLQPTRLRKTTLVSTGEAGKKKACVETTNSSWEYSAT